MSDTETFDLDVLTAAGRELAEDDEIGYANVREYVASVEALIAEARRLRERTGEWEYGILTVWTEGKQVADDSDWWGGSEREVTLASYERNRRDERFGNPWRSVVVRRIQAGPIERVMPATSDEEDR